jgi:hypothetical protein
MTPLDELNGIFVVAVDKPKAAIALFNREFYYLKICPISIEQRERLDVKILLEFGIFIDSLAFTVLAILLSSFLFNIIRNFDAKLKKNLIKWWFGSVF